MKGHFADGCFETAVLFSFIEGRGNFFICGNNHIFVSGVKFIVMENVKGIPYGLSDFVQLRRGGYYFVDKSGFIRDVENSPVNFFFLRPRRFGKSLFLSMLESYYDIALKDNFDELFSGLSIHDNPTPLRNSFLILHLDLSKISGGKEDFKKNFTDQCRNVFDDFCAKYSQLLPDDTKRRLDSITSASQMLDFLCFAATRSGYGIYLFIDEYDNYTNALLSGDEDKVLLYQALTHGDGELRSFFTMIKARSGSSIRRMFITGVSPVSMDDLTSGFNIGLDHTLERRFNSMAGFSEDEVKRMFDYYSRHFLFNHTVEELLDVMRPWYDNYRFYVNGREEPSLYNSDMVLFFLDRYISSDCEIPSSMVDKNVRTDYAKLEMLIRKDPEASPSDELDFDTGNDRMSLERKRSTLAKIASEGYAFGHIADSFPASEIGRPENFRSLLFYLGMLTVSDFVEGRPKLAIPNNVVREQMYGYLIRMMDRMGAALDDSRLDELLHEMAYRGDWRPVFDYISSSLKEMSSQRDVQKGEYYVHGFMAGCLLKNAYYWAFTDKDMGAAHGYSDIFMEPRFVSNPDIRHSYLVELKYAPAGSSEERIASLETDALSQMRRYLSSPEVLRRMGKTAVHGVCVVFNGFNMVRCFEVQSN